MGVSIRATTVAAGILAVVGGAGCGAGERMAAGELAVETETLGDTVVVRTVSGQVWSGPAELVPELSIGVLEGPEEYMFGQIQALAVAGDGSIYVYDRNMAALRRYGPDGAYLGSIGRRGGGPGEFRNPDGLAVLPDGRVLLRDPGNTRITIYLADGEFLETWPIAGGWSTGRRPYVDTAGNVYTHVLLNRGADIADWKHGLQRFSPNGVVRDTVAPPDWGFQPPQIVARREGSASSSSVPFTPASSWAFSPLGYLVAGVGDRYAVHLLRTGEPPLRIERVVDPVPVQREEKAERERFATWNMRRTDPNWRWTGPPIPDTKPAFLSIEVGDDGRIWVRVPLPAERLPDDPGADQATGSPDRPPPIRWREPFHAYDVFELDGRYLGQVRVPRATRLQVMRGDHVWAISSDELGVQSVVRYRVETGRTGRE